VSKDGLPAPPKAGLRYYEFRVRTFILLTRENVYEFIANLQKHFPVVKSFLKNQVIALGCVTVTSWQLAVASYQLPVTSCQLAVGSYQLPVGSYQLAVISWWWDSIAISTGRGVALRKIVLWILGCEPLGSHLCPDGRPSGRIIIPRGAQYFTVDYGGSWFTVHGS